MLTRPHRVPFPRPEGLFPNWESSIHQSVRIIVKRTLRLFWESNSGYADAKRALEDWHAQVSQADWATPAGVKHQYGDASILKGSRVVFNICGNKYRLVVKINYAYRVVYIRFVGTHVEYDAIDAETV